MMIFHCYVSSPEGNPKPHPNPTSVDPLRQVGSTFEAAKHAVGLDVCRRWQLWTTTKNPKQIEQ